MVVQFNYRLIGFSKGLLFTFQCTFFVLCSRCERFILYYVWFDLSTYFLNIFNLFFALFCIKNNKLVICFLLILYTFTNLHIKNFYSFLYVFISCSVLIYNTILLFDCQHIFSFFFDFLWQVNQKSTCKYWYLPL